MVDKDGRDFAERNLLIPLCALADSGAQPAGLDIASLCKQIEAAGMRSEYFFYNPANRQAPYSYWRGPVLLEFPNLEGRIISIKAIANRLEGEINASVACRDFDRFLDLVDARLAPELFMEVFGTVPDRDKFRLFERLWRFNPYATDVFPDDFARRAYRYRGVTDQLPPAAADGRVRVYLGADAGAGPQETQVWTTDINRALMAAGTIPAAPVFQGRVRRDHLIPGDGGRSDREVLVKPSLLEEIRRMNLIDLADFEGEMEAAGIMAQYRRRAGQIKPGWFHKPAGIHGAGHTRRVLMLSLLLAHLEKLNRADRDLLAGVAVYHDIGRDNDGYDPGHGQASYARTRKERLVPWSDKGEEEVFRFVVENHDLPDSKAYQRVQGYEARDVDRTLRLYATFKDADGLDRVRLGDLNPDYLRTASAPRLLLVAYQLYCQPDWLEQRTRAPADD